MLNRFQVPYRQIRRSAVWFVFLTALAQNAYCFESGEHCGVANLAVHIALEFLASHEQSADRKEELLRARRAFEPGEIESACFPASWTHPEKFPFSYGKVAALVDYVNNPNDLLLRYGRASGFSKTPAELSEVYFENSADLVGRFSVASHNNVDHFQGLLLSSFKFWHDAAVDTGSHPGGLFEALVKSAVASHFLEDFFAPGHMITPRDGFPDIIALSWHDHYNELGMPLTLWNWDALQPLIDFIQHSSPADKEIFDRYFQSISAYRVKNDEQPAPQRITLVEAIAKLDTIMQPGNEDATRCPKDNGEHASLPALAATANGRPVAEGHRDRTLCVYGDGMLDGHVSYSEHSIPAQKALMVLVEAMYIVAVVEGGANPQRRPTEYVWCPRIETRHSPRQVVAPQGADAAQGAQCVQLLEQARQLCEVGDCSIPSSVAKNLCHGDQDPAPGCTRFYASTFASIDVVSYALQPATSPNPYVVFDPIFSVSVSFRAGEGTESAGAGSWSIETLPIGWVGARDFLRDRNFQSLGIPNIGLALGYEGAFTESEAFRRAYTSRLIWAITRLDTQISLVGERVYVTQLPLRDSGWGVGGRFEVGFSFLTAFVAAATEPTIQNNLLKRGLVLQAGVSIAFSGGRAKHLLDRFHL
jgi:hypothetical protein